MERGLNMWDMGHGIKNAVKSHINGDLSWEITSHRVLRGSNLQTCTCKAECQNWPISHDYLGVKSGPAWLLNRHIQSLTCHSFAYSAGTAPVLLQLLICFLRDDVPGLSQSKSFLSSPWKHLSYSLLSHQIFPKCPTWPLTIYCPQIGFHHCFCIDDIHFFIHFLAWRVVKGCAVVFHANKFWQLIRIYIIITFKCQKVLHYHFNF